MPIFSVIVPIYNGEKYIKEQINRSAICLPSTSPANAVKSEADLINEWKVIK